MTGIASRHAPESSRLIRPLDPLVLLTPDFCVMLGARHMPDERLIALRKPQPGALEFRIIRLFREPGGAFRFFRGAVRVSHREKTAAAR